MDAPEENPLPGNTSLAWHISLTKSVVPLYIIPLPSPGKITGYRALKEVLWRPHNMKICLKSKEDNGIDEINGINLILYANFLPALWHAFFSVYTCRIFGDASISG